ncbi:MAG TPA: hypothetical protein VGR92_00485 [Steroidobacteraceae bacterium]|nr:hypothetical protein [Steroidobacteraceae bacterium]
MHTDLNEKSIARRLNVAGNEPSETPYDWPEFQRRRQRSALTRAIERNRPAAIAASLLAAVLVTALPYVHPAREHALPVAAPHTVARSNVSERQEQARTRAIEGWLAGLPHDHAIVRVGTHAAVGGLQDQIAALDDLMSAERVSGAPPGRLDALERQRAQLVSSLAQVQYAELLASATP